MAQAEKANQRIDLMDTRCDQIEDTITNLRDHVLKKEKELEDMQLERQIETLRRELADAKTGGDGVMLVSTIILSTWEHLLTEMLGLPSIKEK